MTRNVVQDLYNEGARNFALASLPPLGCLPAVISIYGNKGLGPEGCVAPLNEVARAGNDVFRHVFMPKLERQLVGSKLVYLDVYTVLFELAANPRAFGDPLDLTLSSLFALLTFRSLCAYIEYGRCFPVGFRYSMRAPSHPIHGFPSILCFHSLISAGLM